jgi:hypothetical protein
MQPDPVGLAEARAAFETALRYLNEIPLTSREIRGALDAAAVSWAQMLAGTVPASGARRQDPERLPRLATASEELLDVFEKLSVHYGRSMQMLVG